jgi:hypothetical protein
MLRILARSPGCTHPGRPRAPDTQPPDTPSPEAGPDSAAAAVGALYEASALGLIRMAYVMLGDLPSAEDVVQEAFCGLYRRWDGLASTDGTAVLRAHLGAERLPLSAAPPGGPPRVRAAPDPG